MCIIASAAKKEFMKRAEVLESMRINSDGFFMAALRPDGTRDTIRTLDEKEAIDFFDNRVKDDDAFVMHARIPSRGAKTIENVHGWEEDKILFMHNMTITDIDSMMKRVKWNGTDSEFFFRKLFIPYYRGLGGEAYKDGKFHPDLDNFVTHFVGYSNKFCFIMPDNKVIRYGNWVSEPDRKLNGEIAFYASNSGYKVSAATHYGRTYPEKGAGAAHAAGFRHASGYDIESDLYGYDTDYDEYGAYTGLGYDFEERGGKYPSYRQGRGRKKSKSEQKKKEVFDGKMLLKLAGPKGVCKLALSHLVLENALSCREIYSEDPTETEVEKLLRGYFPGCFKGTFVPLKTALSNLVEQEDLGYNKYAIDVYIERFAAEMAAVYEEKIVKEKAPYAVTATEWSINLGIESTVERIKVLCRLMNISLYMNEIEPDKFVRGYAMSKDGSEVLEVDVVDMLGVSEMTDNDVNDAVQLILCYLNDVVDTLFDDMGVQDEQPPLAEPESNTDEVQVAADSEMESVEALDDVNGDYGQLEDMSLSVSDDPPGYDSGDSDDTPTQTGDDIPPDAA